MAENPRQDLFLDISQNLVDAEIRDLRNYVIGAKILPAGFVEKANAHQIFNQLEKQQKLKLGDLSLLANILRKIGRNDYAEQAEELAENEMKDSSKEQSDLACKRRRLDTTETKETEEQRNALCSAISTLYKNTLNIFKPLPWDPRFTLDLDAVFTSLELVSLHGSEDRGMPHGLQDRGMPRALQDRGMPRALQDRGMPRALQDRGMPRALQDRGMPRALQDREMPHALQDRGMPRALQDRGMPRALQDRGMPRALQGRGMPRALQDRRILHALQDRGMLDSLDSVIDYQEKNVLVVGDAGSGKSTLLSKTALDWSCGKGRLAEMNKIVFLVRLREIQPGESIAGIIWDQCVTQSEDISVASLETCLRENESKLVFLLDGYDELVPGTNESKETIPRLLAKKLYPRSTVIVTSRPFFGVSHNMTVDLRVKVVGFSLDNVEKYVSTYFDTVGRSDLAGSLVKTLQANIIARSLIQAPMFLMLICVLWEEDPTRVFPGTMSGLYQELLICVIRKYCVREGLPMSSDDVPSVVSTALLHLGKLALESLLSGESLINFGKTTATQNIDILLKLGIVSKEVSASRLHPREQLNFPHKTMQEFLAGRYVADTVNTSSGHLHELVPLDTVDALQRQSNLVQFICGCGGKATREILTQFNKLHLPEDVSGNADSTLKKLCLMSLYEGQDCVYFPIVSTLLSSLDLTINVPSKEEAALKHYLNHAPAVPEGRSLKLTVLEASKGDAVKYLSCLVENHLPDLQLYLEFPGHCYIGSKLGKLIHLLKNVTLVQTLNLRKTGLTPESLQSLGGILPELVKLEGLDLSDNEEMGDIDMRVPNEEFEMNLTILNLRKSGLGDVFVKSLAAVLHHLHSLVDIDLSHNNIGLAGLEPFSALEHSVANLKVLNLFGNKIGDVCMRSLAAVLHHLPCLKVLDLSYNNVGNEGLEPFAAIKQSVADLKVLKLHYNKIGDVCMRSLAAALHHLPCLKTLDLSYNYIGNEGLEPFAAIQHPVANLKELHLYDNKIGNVCLRSLAAVLHHLPCLKKLDLSCNSIRDADLASLATSLHHVPSLQFITLCNNPITEMDIKDFAQTIPKMPALKQLNLVPYKTAHLDDTASTSISTMLTRLPALERLNLTNISMQDAGFRDMVTAVEERSVDLKLLYSEHLVPRATTGSIQLCGDGPEDGNYDIFDLCSDDETSSD
ncbi:uncharacterized protein LOC144878581 isoform X3 [Branchiostoma floridae x Branchiostoma japonicum]